VSTSADQDALVTRDGPIMTLTFNRPQTRNAMTWAMYDRLLETCEEVDADESIRVLVLRGAGGKAFVAGTDISQFKVFETAEDGLAYERDGAARSARLERVKKPVIAQIQGFAVGGGFNLTGVLRPPRRDAPTPSSARPSRARWAIASPWRPTRASWISWAPPS
jgi:enoyl-CoA hydratase/carnithine racemase